MDESLLLPGGPLAPEWAQGSVDMVDVKQFLEPDSQMRLSTELSGAPGEERAAS